MTAADDNEFETVAQKKSYDKEDGGYRRREKKTFGQNVHAQKLVSQHAEDKVTMKESMKGPQMTRKRQEWQRKTQRANQAGNTTLHSGNYQRRGLRELSYEIKPEWPTIE